jgi:hypothetical protein
VERPQQWSSVLEDFVRKYDHVVLLAFCRTCCADVFAANGRVDAAEEELAAAITELTDAGQRSRCVNPAARLAEIRVFQGRFDEAEELLAGFDGAPDATCAAVALRLARVASRRLPPRFWCGGSTTSDGRVRSPFRSWSSSSMRVLPRGDLRKRATLRRLSRQSPAHQAESG